MKLTPYALKLADEWLNEEDGDLRELVEIIGVSRGGIDAELQGHCYREVRDDQFSAQMIESVIDDDRRFQLLVSGEVQPTEEELEAWREAHREAQPHTEFYVWKVPFSRESLYISTVHGKNGFVEKIDGPFHSADAALPYGEIVYD